MDPEEPVNGIVAGPEGFVVVGEDTSSGPDGLLDAAVWTLEIRL